MDSKSNHSLRTFIGAAIVLVALLAGAGLGYVTATRDAAHADGPLGTNKPAAQVSCAITCTTPRTAMVGTQPAAMRGAAAQVGTQPPSK